MIAPRNGPHGQIEPGMKNLTDNNYRDIYHAREKSAVPRYWRNP